jgi:hypothetical protein
LIRQIRLTTEERRKDRTEEKINERSLSGIVVAVDEKYWERNGWNDDKDVWISTSKRCIIIGRQNMEVVMKNII